MKNIKFYPAVLLIVLSLTAIMQLNCSKELNTDSNNSNDFGIYISKNQIVYNDAIDYSQINLDTIKLIETPFLTANDIESYDTVNHIINLKKSKYDLVFPPARSSLGQMFVVRVNKKRQYCGFFWPSISSIPCHWIFIDEPFGNNTLAEYQIQINARSPFFSHPDNNDPRNNPMIIEYLTNHNKLTGDSKPTGSGFNFHLVIKSEFDTSAIQLLTPINALDLETKPFIAYNEIQLYDTTNHILDLTIDHETIMDRIKGYGRQFVVVLDDKRQYSGLLISRTSSIIYPDITIISPTFSLDSLQSNQIKISLGYPNASYFDGEDLRLTKAIVDRLKQDNKIK